MFVTKNNYNSGMIYSEPSMGILHSICKLCRNLSYTGRSLVAYIQLFLVASIGLFSCYHNHHTP